MGNPVLAPNLKFKTQKCFKFLICHYCICCSISFFKSSVGYRCGLQREKFPDLNAFRVKIHSLVAIICINITELSPITVPNGSFNRCEFVSLGTRAPRGRTIRKVMGGGGWGIFSWYELFFFAHCLCRNFFSR